jgi:hypothetical protein
MNQNGGVIDAMGETSNNEHREESGNSNTIPQIARSVAALRISKGAASGSRYLGSPPARENLNPPLCHESNNSSDVRVSSMQEDVSLIPALSKERNKVTGLAAHLLRTPSMSSSDFIYLTLTKLLGIEQARKMAKELGIEASKPIEIL